MRAAIILIEQDSARTAADASDLRRPPMPDSRDLWYIRFPNGKVARAAGVAFIRQQLIAGRVPADAHLRRNADDHWLPVADHPEFADLRDGDGLLGNGSWHDISLNGETTKDAVPTVASRMDATQMRLPGVRRLLDEVSMVKDDFPEPLTPVTTMNWL